MKKAPILLTLALLCFSTLATAQDSRFGLQLRIGTNYSDAQYGIEPLHELLPIEEYPIFSTSENPHWGYSAGIGAHVPFGKRVLLITNVEYFQMNYQVSSAVFNTGIFSGSAAYRADVPTIMLGNINYQYLNIETGLRLSLNDQINKGMFLGVFISDMIHLQTDWTLLTRYEDYQIEQAVNYNEYQEGIDFPNVFFLGANIGYNLPISEQLSIAPLFDFRYGLRPIADTNPAQQLHPIAFGFHINASWTF